MATSTAHQESGKFDFRFGSDKFLPFEGAGAVDSKWSLEVNGVVMEFYDNLGKTMIRSKDTTFTLHRPSPKKLTKSTMQNRT